MITLMSAVRFLFIEAKHLYSPGLHYRDLKMLMLAKHMITQGCTQSEEISFPCFNNKGLNKTNYIH